MNSRQKQSEVSRRDFLRVGSLSFVGLSMAERAALAATRSDRSEKNCILIMMTGGASQLETFDPKPDAPAEIRGPLKAISTTVPGLQGSEAFPQLAQRTGQFSLIRSLYHDAAPIHDVSGQDEKRDRQQGEAVEARGHLLGDDIDRLVEGHEQQEGGEGRQADRIGDRNAQDH